jgi:hypothetical protein
MTEGCPRSALVLIASLGLAGCALFISDSRRHRECMAKPRSARSVAWRFVELPGPCPHTSVYVVSGGGQPKLPRVSFPIRDELTFRQAFPCVGDGPLGVDFEHERVEMLEGVSRIYPTWIAVHRGRLVVKTSSSPWCKGITPEIVATLLVVPANAPPLIRADCHSGSCSGPPRV